MGLKQNLQSARGDDNRLFAFYIRQDSFNLKISKKLYSIQTLITEIIGLYEFSHLVLLFLTGTVIEARFMSTIFSKIYMQRANASDEKKDYTNLHQSLKTEKVVNK